MQYATAYRKDSAKMEKQVIDMSYKLPAHEDATPACRCIVDDVSPCLGLREAGLLLSILKL